MSETILTRVGVIGDPHAEDSRLEAAIQFLQTANVDVLLCTGDIVTGAGDANRCCHLLEDHGVATVRGNHDRWFFTNGYAEMFADSTLPASLDIGARAFLETLPPTRDFDTMRGKLEIAHGTDTDDMRAVYPGDARWVLEANPRLQRLYAENEYRVLVGGHTHAPMVRAFDHLLLLNPGTLRRNRRGGWGVLVADFAANTATFYEFGGLGTIAAASTVPLPESAEEIPL